MSDAWQSTSQRLCDAVFGWLLVLPRDLAIVLLGTLLGVGLLALRRATTNQARLRLIAADERRLRVLARAARAAKDRERVARRRRTRRLVAGARARCEWCSIGASVVALCAIVPWGRQRLEYLPVRAGEPVRFVVRLPASAIGEVVHIVPHEGVTVDGGWVRSIAAEIESAAPRGKAEWLLHADVTETPYIITVRLRNQSVSHSLIVGTSTYEEPIKLHDGGMETEMQLIPYRPLGLLPSRMGPGIPGWSVLLALVTGGVFFVGRRLLRLS